MRVYRTAALLLCIVPTLVAAETLEQRNDKFQARAFAKMSTESQLAALANSLRQMQTKGQERSSVPCTNNAECGNGVCDLATGVCQCNAGWITPTAQVNNGAACSYQAKSRLRATLLNAIFLGLFGAGNFDLGNNGLGAGGLVLALGGTGVFIGGVIVTKVVTPWIGVPMIIAGGAALVADFAWSYVAESVLIGTGQRKDGNGQDTVW